MDDFLSIIALEGGIINIKDGGVGFEYRLWLIVLSFSSQIDVISDFLYWDYISRNDDLIKKHHKVYSTSLFIFSLIGVCTLIYQMCMKFIFIRDIRHHSKYIVSLICTIGLEDVPQMILCLHISSVIGVNSTALFTYLASNISLILKLIEINYEVLYKELVEKDYFCLYVSIVAALIIGIVVTTIMFILVYNGEL